MAKLSDLLGNPSKPEKPKASKKFEDRVYNTMKKPEKSDSEKKGKADPYFTKVKGGSLQPVKAGDGIADVFAKIYNLMREYRAEDVKERELEKTRRLVSEREDDVRHNKLIEAITKRKPTAEKIEPEKDDEGIISKLLKSVLGLVSRLMGKLKGILTAIASFATFKTLVSAFMKSLSWLTRLGGGLIGLARALIANRIAFGILAAILPGNLNEDYEKWHKYAKEKYGIDETHIGRDEDYVPPPYDPAARTKNKNLQYDEHGEIKIPLGYELDTGMFSKNVIKTKDGWRYKHTEEKIGDSKKVQEYDIEARQELYAKPETESVYYPKMELSDVKIKTDRTSPLTPLAPGGTPTQSFPISNESKAVSPASAPESMPPGQKRNSPQSISGPINKIVPQTDINIDLKRESRGGDASGAPVIINKTNTQSMGLKSEQGAVTGPAEIRDSELAYVLDINLRRSIIL